MINLLPENEKRELTNIRRQKIIAIIGMLLIFFIIALSLILWVVSLNIASEIEFKKAMILSEEHRLGSEETKLIKARITALNENLSKIKTLMGNNEKLTKTIKKISKDIPNSVYLTNISYQDRQVVVYGFAPTRDDLLAFKENLEKEADFQNVSFPPINWVKPKAITFTVYFSVADDY